MKKKYHQFLKWCKTKIETITPGKNAVQGATFGLVIISVVLWILFAILVAISSKDFWVLLLFIGFTLAVLLASFLILSLVNLINKIPKTYKLGLLIAVPLLVMISFDKLLPWLRLSFCSSKLESNTSNFFSYNFDHQAWRHCSTFCFFQNFKISQCVLNFFCGKVTLRY